MSIPLARRTSTRSSRPSRSNAHWAAAMSIRAKLPIQYVCRAVILQQPADHERAASIADVELDPIANAKVVSARKGPARR